MKIKNIINSKLQKVSVDEVIAKLGYPSNKKAIKALDKFINSKTLYDWLHCGFYDFKYTAVDFFKKLCSILNIEDSIIHIYQDKRKWKMVLRLNRLSH